MGPRDTTKKAHSNIILISNINNQSLQVIYSFIFWCESNLFISTLPVQAISAISLIINIGILSLILSLFGFSGVGILSVPYALSLGGWLSLILICYRHCSLLFRLVDAKMYGCGF
jgi:hypothetical protein